MKNCFFLFFVFSLLLLLPYNSNIYGQQKPKELISSQKIGSITYYIYSDGSISTSQKIGNYKYYDFDDGSGGTSNKIGNFNYYDWNNSNFNSNKNYNSIYNYGNYFLNKNKTSTNRKKNIFIIDDDF